MHKSNFTLMESTKITATLSLLLYLTFSCTTEETPEAPPV